jgi:hypothetical protein
MNHWILELHCHKCLREILSLKETGNCKQYDTNDVAVVSKSIFSCILAFEGKCLRDDMQVHYYLDTHRLENLMESMRRRTMRHKETSFLISHAKDLLLKS